MKDVEVTERRFFCLFKKTYKTKITNKQYKEMLKKYIRVEDTIARIMEAMPIIAVATTVGGIINKLKKVREGYRHE